MTDKELDMLEMFKESPDPQYGGSDYDLFDSAQARTTDAFGVPVSSLAGKPVGEKDMGAVQGGGARRSRRRRAASRKTRRAPSRRGRGRGRGRSTGKRNKFSFNLRAQIRLRH